MGGSIKNVPDRWKKTASDFNLLVNFEISKGCGINFKLRHSQGEETVKVINIENNGKKRRNIQVILKYI